MASILVVQHISASEENQKYLCQLAAIAFLSFSQDASLCLTCCGDKRAAFHWHADRSCQQMQVLHNGRPNRPINSVCDLSSSLASQ